MTRLIATFHWIKDNVLAVLIASFVIPGVLAAFNEQSAITKAIYETDYKATKTKFQECDYLHSEYISTAEINAGAARIIQNHFNLDAISENGSSEIYFVVFKGAMGTYQKTLERVKELYGKTSRCYAELAADYENLALGLNVIQEFRNETTRRDDKVAPLVAKREAIAQDLSKRVDPDTLFAALMSGDEKSMRAVLQTANFGDLAQLQFKNIELESAVRSEQRARFIELNKLFSNELNRRFQRGLLSYFWSLVRI